MKDGNLISYVSAGVTFLTAGLAHDITQLILLILGCIATAVSLAYTLWKWYRKAKADGKITEDEIDEAMDIIHDHVKKGDDDESKK